MMRMAFVHITWIAIALACSEAAAAQAIPDLRLGQLNLARAIGRSEQCGFVDHRTATTALFNVVRTAKRQAGDPANEGNQVEAQFQDAAAEGRAATAETCARYSRRSDLLEQQVELVEMLAYGAGPIPK